MSPEEWEKWLAEECRQLAEEIRNAVDLEKGLYQAVQEPSADPPALPESA